MNRLRSFLPTGIGGQIAIVITISVFIFQAVVTTIFFFPHAERPFEYSPDQIKTLVELIAARPADQRQALLSEIADAFPRLDMTLAQLPPAAGATPLIGGEFRLGPNYRVISLADQSGKDAADGHSVAIGLPDGQFIKTRISPRSRAPFSPTIVSLLIIATCTIFLVCGRRGRLQDPCASLRWSQRISR